MSSMDAPVVPMKLASTAPIARMAVLSPGLPCRLPRMKMPPATVNSAVSRITNGMYSANSACTRLTPATAGPKVMAKGSKNARPQAAATLPKWWCQKMGAKSGMSAIDSRMPANGTPHSTESVLPSMSAAMHRPGNRAPAAATQGAARREIFMVLSPSMRCVIRQAPARCAAGQKITGVSLGFHWGFTGVSLGFHWGAGMSNTWRR